VVVVVGRPLVVVVELVVVVGRPLVVVVLVGGAALRAFSTEV
jgi:hypothetical protein